jgi:hypothetical protein
MKNKFCRVVLLMSFMGSLGTVAHADSKLSDAEMQKTTGQTMYGYHCEAVTLPGCAQANRIPANNCYQCNKWDLPTCVASDPHNNGQAWTCLPTAANYMTCESFYTTKYLIDGVPYCNNRVIPGTYSSTTSPGCTGY